MSAELDYVEEQDGSRRGAVVLTRESAWHREGIVLPEAPSLDEALRLGGLDFEVAKVPHFLEVPLEIPAQLDELGTELVPGTVTHWEKLEKVMGYPFLGHRLVPHHMLQNPESFTVVRTDRWTPLGTVGTQWAPLQNRDAFRPLQLLLDDGLAYIETAGSLRGGKQVWMLVRFDHRAILQRAIAQSPDGIADVEALLEEVLPFGLFSNDHTGSAMARIKETGIRVVCANTYDMSMDRYHEGISVEVSHSGNVQENYRAAAELMLGTMAERFRSFSQVRSALMAEELPVQAFKRLVLDTAVPIMHLEAKLSRKEATWQTEKALENASAKRARITTLWTEGKGHTGDHSAWEAFNGMVQWADHDPDATRSSSRLLALGKAGTLGKPKLAVQSRLMTWAMANEQQRANLLKVAGS